MAYTPLQVCTPGDTSTHEDEGTTPYIAPSPGCKQNDNSTMMVALHHAMHSSPGLHSR